MNLNFGGAPGRFGFFPRRFHAAKSSRAGSTRTVEALGRLLAFRGVVATKTTNVDKCMSAHNVDERWMVSGLGRFVRHLHIYKIIYMCISEN